MVRTAASTSADVSRLVSRNARNFCLKSADRVSRRSVMGSACALRNDAYQPSDIITILILAIYIDKKYVVAQLLGSNRSKKIKGALPVMIEQERIVPRMDRRLGL